MKFIFFSMSEKAEYEWKEQFPGLIHEKDYIDDDDGKEYALYIISFDYLDQYQQFMDEVLKQGYYVQILPPYPDDERLATVGEGLPLLYVYELMNYEV